ncbi:MAG: GNAT family N-acetyltransferase [Pseudorhodobacter sp.]
MTTNEIRRMKQLDKAEWLMLWQQYNTFYERDVAGKITERVWNALHSGAGEPSGYVATKDGMLVGFTHYFFLPSTSDWGPRCYMQDLFVTPSMRGNGIGEALIQSVYADADNNDAAQTYWLTATTNTTAQELYDRVASRTPFVKYRR